MAEYIDLYNAAREPLNRVWQRGVPLPEGTWRLGVRVWIGNSSGQYLISQRNPNLYSHPLFWESTGGGVSAGESSRTAAVRELYEELGISTQEDALLFLNTELVSRGPEFLDNCNCSVHP
ncbi:MAG: NUDIX domain-containing protein [Clostridia bacterium]|nr:NUDIX domain-containing protein [Clostridia bacterium]